MRRIAILTVFILFMSYAQAGNAEPFALPQLAYAYNDLAPVIDVKTMEIHYTKHHQAYVDNLNAEIVKDKGLKGKTLNQIVASVSSFNLAVRNNAGGHWNHSFFWSVMAPQEKTGSLSPDLQQALNQKFGSLEDFKTIFEKQGVSRFGSGWVWLILEPSGNLAVVTTPNQDNPLMDDAAVKGVPLLANDLWEHAYYLQYQNKRADYLKNWWSVVNWDQVSKNFEKAQALTSRHQ